jgi:hypothetical protein
MKIVLAMMLMASSLIFPTQFAYADSAVGTVVKASGAASTLRRNFIFPLSRTDEVFWKDEIETRGAARLEIVFKDKTLLQMGDNSKIAIDEMVYEPNKKGTGVFTLSQGVFRMVSGAINKVNGGTLTINTPIATIGVRGTDFWGHQTDKKLTMALLDNGILEITTPTGTITLTKPNSAVVIEAGKDIAPPFILSDEEVAQAKTTVQ